MKHSSSDTSGSGILVVSMEQNQLISLHFYLNQTGKNYEA